MPAVTVPLLVLVLPVCLRVCMCERERVCVCARACVCERERKRVCVRERESVCVCEYVTGNEWVRNSIFIRRVRSITKSMSLRTLKCS